MAAQQQQDSTQVKLNTNSLVVPVSAPEIQHQTQALPNLTEVRRDSVPPKRPQPIYRRKHNMELLQPLVSADSIQLQATTEVPGLSLPGRKLQKREADWVAGILVLVFILFTTVRLFFGKYLAQILHAAINYATASRLFRERSLSVSHVSLRLDLIFFITFSLFLYQVFGKRIDFAPQNQFLQYLMLVVGTILFFGAKQILYTFQGKLGEVTNETSEVLYNMNLYNRLIGLGMIPVTLILAFSRLQNTQIVIGIGALITLVCYILMVFRGIKILVRKDFPIYYLILYLCTLEILPLFYIYKLVLV